MKKFIVSGVLCTFAVLGGGAVAHAETAVTTTTTSTSSMLMKIQELMKMIQDLQAKLAAVRGEVQELAADLSEGAQGDDVKKVQEILASDPSLFAVAPTGYFGPITKAALIKFQTKFGLEATGMLDKETREVMKELRAERKDGHVPPGLATSAAAHDRIKAKLEAKWGDCEWGPKFHASDCKKGHDMKVGDDDDDDDNATTTRAEAEGAINDAEDAIDDLKADIADMEDNNDDQNDIDDAKDMLADAKDKLDDANAAFDDEDYEQAEHDAEEVLNILGLDENDEDGNDDGDDDSDDDDADDDDN